MTKKVSRVWGKAPLYFSWSFAVLFRCLDARVREHEVWLDYARDSNYLSALKNEELIHGYDEVRKMLISMINNPDKWCS